jgi:hypothetical protein
MPSKAIPVGMRELMRLHLGSNTPDEEWLGEVGRHQWFAITWDTRIRNSPLAIMMQGGAVCARWHVYDD